MSSIDRFNKEYQKHRMIKDRVRLPARRTIRHEQGTLSKIVLEAQDNQGVWFEVGHIDYQIGRLPTGYQSPELLSTAPGIADGTVLMILGFYSDYENEVKGIGGALLNHIVKLAEMRDIPHIVVLSGINPAVYEAYDFRLADRSAMTWYMSTKALKTRTSAYSTPTTGTALV